MYIFTPNTLIESAKINANFTELETKTDYLETPDVTWCEVGATGNPAFMNNWVNYGSPFNTCAFRKDAMGYVHLKGLVKNGTVGSGFAVFTLPVGYRPIGQQLIVTMSTSVIGRVDITTVGYVMVVAGNNSWASLDNITFKAEL